MDGNLGIKVRRKTPMWKKKLHQFFAGAPTETKQERWVKNASLAGKSALSARVFRSSGTVEDLGVICTKKVTYEFVNMLVDVLQSSDATFSDFKWHTSGTNNQAEVNSHTLAVFSNPDGPTSGTQTEGSTTNIYRSVGTVNYTATKTVVEHGLLNVNTLTAASNNLMDRSQFAAIVVGNGDSIEFTYELTVAAEA
jgi:hypothetical protein